MDNRTADSPAALAPARPRKRRVLLQCMAVLASLVALCEAAGWPFLRDPLVQALQRSAGVNLQLNGDFRLHLLVGPSLAVQHMEMGAGAGVPVPHLLRADDLELRWRWADLWHYRQGGPLRLASLQARTLDAHLVRLANGQASWNVLPRSAEATASAPQPLPAFDRLVLGEGTIRVDDAPTSVQLTVQLRKQDASSDPRPWKAQAQGRYQGAEVRLAVEAADGLPLLLDATTPAPLLPLAFSGRVGSTQLSFEGVAGAIWAGQDLRGLLSVRGRSLQATGRPLGLTLPETPPYRLVATVAREGALWSVVTREAVVGSSRLQAQLQFDAAASPPRLSGRVGGSRLALADLGPAVGADQAPRRAGRVLPDARFDLPSLQRMDANVLVHIDQLDFGTTALAPVNALRMQLRLLGGRLALDGLSAQAAGGQITGSTSLTVQNQRAQWTADLRLYGMDVDRWIRGLRKPAPTATPGRPADTAYLSGTLGAAVSLRGTGNSVAEILGQADGQVRLQLARGQLSHLLTELAGIDLAEALGMLIRGDEPLPLTCAVADAVVRDGVLRSRRIVLDSADTTLQVQGGASLRDETLNLRVVARPKDFSPLTLRTPVTVTGPFTAPKVGVQARGLVARAAGAVVLGSLAPPAALLAFIDPGSNDDKNPPCPTVLPRQP